MHVTVAIPTRKRPSLLANLLSALEQQSLGDLDMTVAVIDNDADASALPVVAAAQARGLLRVSHHLEPVPGIAAARNKALQVATGHALAFIDDDEVPSPSWLHALVQTMQQQQADMVFAPVLAVYGESTPSWIRRSAVFERRRLATAQAVDLDNMRTGNVLISLAWLQKLTSALHFDNRLGLTGGEDTLFFSQAIDRGLRAVWCDEASVTEIVPPSRANASYLCRRYFQNGISSCAIATIRDGQPGRLRELAKGIVLVPAGLVLGTVALIWNAPAAAKWYAKALCGLGKVAGALGHKFEIYKILPATQR